VKYVLDTNAVSALMKGDSSVTGRMRKVNKSAIVIPQPVIAELAYGIERLPRSKRRLALQERFDWVLQELGRVPWTDTVSEKFGVVKAALERRGERIEDLDAAIAAHALVEDAVLVTANVRHLARVPGLKVEDWSLP
jgi:tRNA(fMet)-specific endonuclease VapC